MFASASSLVFPCDQQLLKAGTRATKYPSSPCSTITLMFIVASRCFYLIRTRRQQNVKRFSSLTPAFSILAFGLCRRLRYRSLLRHRHADAPPDEVDGDACQNDDESGPSLRRLVDEEHDEYDGGADDVEHRHDGVAEGSVRAFGFGPSLSESYDARDGEYVEDEGGGDDVSQKVVVEAPVSRLSGRLVRARHDARQHQKRGPDALNDEAPRGHVLVVQLPRRAEEQTVARHRVVGARRSVLPRVGA